MLNIRMYSCLKRNKMYQEIGKGEGGGGVMNILVFGINFFTDSSI